MSSPLLRRILFCAAGFASWSIAQSGVPSTQPAGPKDAFRQYLLDLSQGDGADLPALCVAKSDGSRSLVHDFQTVATAIGHLRAASAKNFGPESVDFVMPQMASPGSVDAMNETDQPDSAMLSGPEAGSIQLIKSGDQWKLNMDWLLHTPEFAVSDNFLKQLAPAIQRTADDITSGRLASPQAAVEALRAREQGIPDTDATTQPATQSPNQPPNQP